jgi:hypothetical protein
MSSLIGLGNLWFGDFLHVPFPTVAFVLIVCVIVNWWMRPRGRFEKESRELLAEAVWLALDVIAKHQQQFNEYQEACAQVIGFENRFGSDAPADAYNELVERRTKVRSELRAVINGYIDLE